MDVFDVAIVGFGATGVSLLHEIQNEAYTYKLANSASIAIIDNKDNFSKGKAFGDAAPDFIVNTPPDLMSASMLEPNSFSKWLKVCEDVNTQWPARKIFSEYLKSTYSAIRMAKVLDISEFHSPVKEIKKVNRFFKLNLENGKCISSREVVMCVGAINSDNFGCLSKIEGYIKHYSDYDEISCSEILIAGSGLTAVDAFKYVDKNKKTKIRKQK